MGTGDTLKRLGKLHTGRSKKKKNQQTNKKRKKKRKKKIHNTENSKDEQRGPH